MWRRITLFLTSLAIVALLQPAAVSAQEGAVWHGSYFNTSCLGEDPVFERDDSRIAFNWGTDSPGSGLNADDFSVRWGTDVNFTAGNYRFYVQADDSFRLWIDFELVLETIGDPNPGALLTQDVSLSAGSHHIQLDYCEYTDTAYVYLDWQNLATNPQGPDFGTPSVPPSVTPGIWTAQYYANPSLFGSPFSIQSESTPLSRDWGFGAPSPGIPADNFSVRWTSQQAFNNGTYAFSVIADDGVRVYLDGQLIIDEFHRASGQTYTSTQTMTYGVHTLAVEYYEATGLASITFGYRQVAASPVPPPATSPASASVTANVLNVRAAPTTQSRIVAKIAEGDSYPVVGRNRDASWWEVNIDGVVGWVYTNFVNVFNANIVPITSNAARVDYPPTGYTATASEVAAIRAFPGRSNAYLGRLPAGAPAQVVGRNGSNTWLMIRYNDITGWVLASAAPINGVPFPDDIPVR